jgi:glycosyltransferase involved in cell wall biosynthesis
VKLLVISDLYPPVGFGGYELDCESFVRGAGERHDVTVLTSRLDAASTPSVPGVRRELPWVGSNRRVRDSAMAPVTAVRAASIVRDTLEEIRPDIVFAFNCVGIPQAGAVAAVLDAGVPLALRLSETFFATELLWGDRFLRHLRPGERGPRAVWGLAMRAVNRAHPALRLRPTAAAEVAVSWASENLRSRTVLPASMRIVHERVVYPRSGHSEELAHLERRPFDRPTVLYLGRVTTGKGIEVAFRALAALRGRHNIDADLLVIGYADAAIRKILSTLSAQLGIDDHVDVAGHAEAARFLEALQGSHAIVVPSLVPDVFPLVIIEAGLARIPIVASRVGGIPEAVTDGEHALLFPPGDAEACADALARVLLEPEATRDRAAAAYAHMLELSPERYVEESEAFVAEALSRLRPTGT